jgi:hypothetical protein
VGEDAIRDAGRDVGMTVVAAAEHLGITKEAVRKRISRGTLRSDKDPDGTVRVYIPPSPTVRSVGQPTSASDTLISEMRDRLHYVEGQLEAERQAHAEARRLLMAALERIPPQLEAPPEPRESPQTSAEEPGSTEPHSATGEAQEAVRRPWWRRLFGG